MLAEVESSFTEQLNDVLKRRQTFPSMHHLDARPVRARSFHDVSYRCIAMTSWRYNSVDDHFWRLLQLGAFCFEVDQSVRGLAVDVEGLWFDYRAGQIGHSVADANGSPPLRLFCPASALNRRDGPRYTLHTS